jgi:HK97 family phage major capsid protein
MDEKMLEKLGEISKAIETRLADGEKVSKDAEGKVIVLEEQLKAIEAKHAELQASIEKREWANVPGVNEGKDKDRFSLCKAINAIATKTWDKAGYEKEVIDAATSKKTMSAGTDTAGGYLIPTQAIQNVIELLRNNLVVKELGATMLNDLVGIPVEIPKVTAGSTAYWVDENATITPSDMTLGQVSLNPKGLAAITQLSNRLLALSVPSAEALVRQDLAQTLAEALDLAALRGSGISGQPLGVANTPGISTVDFTSAAPYISNPGWEQMYDMEGKLADNNALKGNVGYAFHPAVKRELSKVRAAAVAADDRQGNFIMNPATDAQLSQLLGYKFSTTTQIPTNLGGGTETEVYMANWADLLIGQWVGLTLLASQEAGTAFATNQTWVRMITDVDVAVRRPESFCLGTGAQTVLAAV